MRWLMSNALWRMLKWSWPNARYCSEIPTGYIKSTKPSGRISPWGWIKSWELPTMKQEALWWSKVVPQYATKAHGIAELQLHALLTSVLDGVVWADTRARRFTSRKRVAGTLWSWVRPTLGLGTLRENPLSLSAIELLLLRLIHWHGHWTTTLFALLETEYKKFC
jgi:hypothetical protein